MSLSPTSVTEISELQPEERHSKWLKISTFLSRWGVETSGISPIPDGERVDKRIYELFFVWFSGSFNILAIIGGSAIPAFYHLGFRDSLFLILVVNAVATVIPAMFAVFGPKLGMRGMVQARFSWGYYGSIFPCVLSVVTYFGFLIINSIIGGQTLAGISGYLNDNTGIIIIGLLSCLVTFFGYRVVHWCQCVAWIPNVVLFTVMLGIAGKHLRPSEYPTVAAPTPASFFSSASLLAANAISWCIETPDYGVYHDKDASSIRIFIYTYLGLFIPTAVCQIIGAAFTAKAPAVPAWNTGFRDGKNLGSLLASILAPAGGFGKFLIVLVTLTIPPANSLSMYPLVNGFMAITPLFAAVPRYVYSVVATSILIPVAVIGQTQFFGTVVLILSVIGYWSAIFSGIVLVEHFAFRRSLWRKYEVALRWDSPRKLPLGAAAITAFCCAFGAAIPCISQEWYVGPVAKEGTGDIGLTVGFFVGSLVYLLLRPLEFRTWGQ